METVMKQGNKPLHAKPAQVKVSVDPEVAAAFKAACAAASIPMAAELSRFMADYAKGSVKRKAAPDYATRRKRRAAITRILAELEQIKAAEEGLIDNAPENLRDAPIYETAEEYIEALDEAIELLGAMVP